MVHSLILLQKMKLAHDFRLVKTRKWPLRGHCLALPGRRQRITLKRENNFGVGGITGYGLLTEGQTDVEVEIVF